MSKNSTPLLYSDLYALLSQAELQSVAKTMRCEIADVRQDAMLLCWLIATEQSKFDASKGSVRQYIMGHMWRDAERKVWQGGHRVDQDDYEVLSENLIDESADPAQQLMQLEELIGFEVEALTPQIRNLNFEEFLYLSGADLRQIEALSGTPKSTVHRKLSARFHLNRDTSRIGDVTTAKSHSSTHKPRSAKTKAALVGGL